MVIRIYPRRPITAFYFIFAPWYRTVTHHHPTLSPNKAYMRGDLQHWLQCRQGMRTERVCDAQKNFYGVGSISTPESTQSENRRRKYQGAFAKLSGRAQEQVLHARAPLR